MTTRQEDYMNLINIIDLVISLMNLNENLTQGDKQEIMDALDQKMSNILVEINEHLKQQDEKINKILKLLQE